MKHLCPVFGKFEDLVSDIGTASAGQDHEDNDLPSEEEAPHILSLNDLQLGAFTLATGTRSFSIYKSNAEPTLPSAGHLISDADKSK